MTNPIIEVTGFGGMCPVQADGTVNGEPFYFRSRHERWSMSIGGLDVVGEPAWYHEEHYGDWPSAGYITREEADSFIAKAAARWAAGLPGELVDRSGEMQRVKARIQARRSRQAGDAP